MIGILLREMRTQVGTPGQVLRPTTTRLESKLPRRTREDFSAQKRYADEKDADEYGASSDLLGRLSRLSAPALVDKS